MVSFVWSNTALTNHTYHNSVPHGHMTVFYRQTYSLHSEANKDKQEEDKD